MVPVVPPTPAQSRLRASDADRERVAEVVRAAAVDGRLDMGELDERLGAVFAARTYDELAATVTDLPDGGSSLPGPGSGTVAARAVDRSPVPRSGAVAPRVVGGAAHGTSIAVFSETGHSGHWVVPENYAAVAVMGSVKVDLRDADFAAQQVVITAFAMFGSVEIRVPEGVTVRADGIGLFGSFDSAAGFDAGPGAPVLVVRGAGLFGSVELKRPGATQGALGRGGPAALDRDRPGDPDHRLDAQRDRDRP